MRRTLVTIALVLAALPATAQERIVSYDSEVSINADGSLDVTEHITVRAEGREIRRGIYRDFPTRYRDRHGNNVVVGFDMLGVERNGEPEPWFTERMANGIRINTGNDDFLPVPATHRFTLRYRTTRQLGFFEAHDELYWNAIGTGWIFPIDAGGVDVRLPSPVPADQMGVEAYTGPQGAQGRAWTAELPADGVARYRLTAPLAPREGFTVVLTFPKGIVPEPSQAQRVGWFLADNRGVLVALVGLLALLGFVTREWRRVGRDPRPGPVIARYFPPEGHTPASLRYVKRMGYDMRCFSADVLSLAVAGQVRIEREEKFFKDQWSLQRTGEPAAETALTEAPRALLGGLFTASRRTLTLKNTNASIVQRARDAHRTALDTALRPRYFQRNRKSLVVALVLSVVSLVVSLVVSGGAGIPAIGFTHVTMAMIVFAFARLVRAPTTEGRALLDEIAGLELYLSVAERDELSAMPGPGAPPVLDAARYEALLPYAVALEVEDAWTRKFTAAVGAAAAAAAASSMAWYGGGSFGNLGDMSKALGSSLTSQISSASSPPGSSSGGGGGSSGGGGGGGGGGGR